MKHFEVKECTKFIDLISTVTFDNQDKGAQSCLNSFSKMLELWISKSIGWHVCLAEIIARKLREPFLDNGPSVVSNLKLTIDDKEYCIKVEEDDWAELVLSLYETETCYDVVSTDRNPFD